MLSLQSMIVSAAIVGALLAYAAYGKFKKSRGGDLRSEVCEERESLRAVIETLPAQLELAKHSRRGATNRFGSGSANSKSICWKRSCWEWNCRTSITRISQPENWN